MAPREWRLKVAEKLSKYKFDQKYANIINELRRDQHTPEKYQQLQEAFVKYNDRQDQFRNVPKTWRDLCPDLAKEIEHEQTQ